MLRHAIAGLVAAAAAALFALPASANGFDSWAAIVVAGDFRAHSGAPSEVFDNGRRDITKALTRLGFAESHVKQFSVRPETDMETHPLTSDIDTIRTEFRKLAQQGSGGCLLYFTSHGNQDGILVGNTIVSPRTIAQMVDQTCNDRMTVVIVSACFSGVFVPALQSPNRMIMTAARRDRTSFGCGEANVYTFFDQCVLESLPQSRDFPALGAKVQACVAEREMKEGAMPPSEPQVDIGYNIAQSLGIYAFTGN
jgi:hypothetical protein